MLTNYELRRNARYHLGGGAFKQPWAMTAVAYVLVSIILSALSFTGIGTILVGGPLVYGYTRILYKIALGSQSVDINDVFCGFKENFVQSLLLYLMQSLYTMLWSLLFVIPGIVKSYAYSMAVFLQQRTGASWSECLDASQKYMDGYKWQLFCLDLSFIGWYILGALCFGVGIFFVYPYHATARVEFFMSVLGEEGEVEDYEEVIAEEVDPADPFEEFPSAEEIYGEEVRRRDESADDNDTIGKDQNLF